jgi:hypothetical protein
VAGTDLSRLAPVTEPSITILLACSRNLLRISLRIHTQGNYSIFNGADYFAIQLQFRPFITFVAVRKLLIMLISHSLNDASE